MRLGFITANCATEIYGEDFPRETFRVLKEKEVRFEVGEGTQPDQLER